MTRANTAWRPSVKRSLAPAYVPSRHATFLRTGVHRPSSGSLISVLCTAKCKGTGHSLRGVIQHSAGLGSLCPLQAPREGCFSVRFFFAFIFHTAAWFPVPFASPKRLFWCVIVCICISHCSFLTQLILLIASILALLPSSSQLLLRLLTGITKRCNKLIF